MKSQPIIQPNLILQQRSLLKKIYNQGENLWKVLIFDNFNRQINSSLFKMKDLRESNITLYFHIKDNRQQLHGVTAIYLVQPTNENLQLIIADFQEDLYSSVIIHFSSEPQAHIISNFAKSLAKTKPNSLTKISKVEYSCLGYHTVSRNMAVMQNNSEIINLICLLKNKPIFVYGPKEEQQVQFIKERLKDSALFGKEQELISLKQPHNIVFFYNREADYFPVLLHGITYSGLIQSIYKLLPNGQKIQRGQQAPFDIDLNDQIWTQKRNLSISDLGLSETLNIIKVKLMGDKERLNQVNQLTERQKKVQSHMNMASGLIKDATTRKLNQYSECQLELYRKRVLTNQLKNDIIVLLQTTSNQEDKVRLILITLLSCEHISPAQIEQFESKVPELKRSKLYTQLKNKINKQAAGGQTGMVGGAGKIFKKFSIGLLSNFKSGDKFVVTKCVERVGNLKQNELKEMGLSMSSLGEVPSDVKIGNIIVYCVGGACLNEQANLSKFDNRVIYTGDKMINALDLIG